MRRQSLMWAELDSTRFPTEQECLPVFFAAGRGTRKGGGAHKGSTPGRTAKGTTKRTTRTGLRTAAGPSMKKTTASRTRTAAKRTSKARTGR